MFCPSSSQRSQPLRALERDSDSTMGFTARYTTDDKQQLPTSTWSCQSFNGNIGQLKRQGLCDASGKKLIGRLRLLNKLLDQSDCCMWLYRDDNREFKLRAAVTDYDNMTFEVWHRATGSKMKKKQFDLLLSLLDITTEAKDPKKKSPAEAKRPVWKYAAIEYDDGYGRDVYYANWSPYEMSWSPSKTPKKDDLIRTYPGIDKTGIRFFYSKRSESYDFFVRLDAELDDRIVVRVGKWYTDSAKLVIKYREGDEEFEGFMNHHNQLDFIIKRMKQSMVMINSSNKQKDVNRTRQHKNKRLVDNAR
jgi:hypothetical protein